MTKEELTIKIVKQKGWDKLETITANMLSEYTSIGNSAFEHCSKLTFITIPNSITSIGNFAFASCTRLTSVTISDSVMSIGRYAFYECSGLTSVIISSSVISIGVCAFLGCTSLTSVTIPDSVTFIGERVFRRCGFKTEKKYDEEGRLIAYKGFKHNMTCLGFKYEEGKTYELNGRLKLYERGFHACLNPMGCFNYYSGKIGKNVVFHEVYLEGISDELHNDSNVVARKITIGRKITLSEMADIASGRKQEHLI